MIACYNADVLRCANCSGEIQYWRYTFPEDTGVPGQNFSGRPWREDIDFEYGLAVCASCRTPLRVVSEEIDRVELLRSTWSGIETHSDSQDLSISQRTPALLAALTTAVGLILVGFPFLMFLVDRYVPHKGGNMRLESLLLPALFAILLSYTIPGLWLNRTRLRLRGTRLDVTSGPLPMPGQHRVSFDGLAGLDLLCTRELGRSGKSRRYTYQLVGETTAKARTTLMGGFREPHECLVLADICRRWLAESR